MELETIGDEFYKLIEDTMVFLSNIFMNIYELSQNSIKSFKCLKETCKNVDTILPPPSPQESSESISINQNVEEIDDDIIEITPENYASVEKKNPKKDSMLNQMLNSDKNTKIPITMISGTSSNSAIRASINMSPSKKANLFKRSNKFTNKPSAETTDLATESQLKKRLRSQAKLDIEKPKCIIGFGTQFNELKKKYENRQAQLKSKNLSGE